MSSLLTGPTTLGTQWLAIPAVIALTLFLGFSSQWLFYTADDLQPGRLTTNETILFNGLIVCLFFTYYKACTVDPGRYVWGDNTAAAAADKPGQTADNTHRWCKKCQAPKPPRAHHCRHCARCVPKMDHHCPWTGNCVSMQTFPYFLRFVVFANVSLWNLGILLCHRFYALWDQRNLPAYLGPTLPQLILLTMLGLVCSATTLLLGIMLYNTMQSWLFNTTMIESWEMDRHEAVVERYRSTAVDGTFWEDGEEDDEEDEDEDEDGAYGNSYNEYDENNEKNDENTPPSRLPPNMRIEFPYDLGFFENMAQAMGTRNMLLWLFPFDCGGPKVAPGGTGLGWDWPENGFNERYGMWPPTDPERQRPAAWASENSGSPEDSLAWQTNSPEEDKAAFQARQAADFRRRRLYVQEDHEEEGGIDEFEQGMDGKPGWTNADGDRLRDYGVDEEADEDGDEDVPLGELLRRKKGM